MKKSLRRPVGIFLLLCLLFVIFLPLVSPVRVLAEGNAEKSQGANFNQTVSRFAGIDQYETSSKISQAGWPGTSDAVVLAAGTQDNLIDAMSAGPLAAVLKAPIVLTDRENQLNSYAKSEISRLKPQKVYVTSGRAVIKSSVLEELKLLGITPVELGGYDQYETAVNIAKEMQALGDKFTKLAVVAGGVSPADALSIGSIAAAEKIPVLATKKDELPLKVKDYLDSLDGLITDSYVIGGTAVVSDAVKNSLPGYQQRYYGETKYGTNLDVLKQFADHLNYKAVYLANGETLVDALAGVPLAAQTEAPIILTNQSMDKDLLNYAKIKLSPITIALGGEAVVTTDTLGQLSYDWESANGQVIGSDNPDMLQKLPKTLLISGDNLTLENAATDASIYIKGNNNALKNVDIKGTLFIDPGAAGTLSLDKVTAAQTVVMSGSQTGIRLKDVKLDNLRIVSSDKIEIAPTGNSEITCTVVSSTAVIDASQGTWGIVRVAGNTAAENVVELKGTFSHNVFLSSPGILKAQDNAAVNKVIVMPQKRGLITLDGSFQVVQIEQQAQVSLTAVARINNLVTHAQTALNVEAGASVEHLYNGDFSTLTGDGAQDLPAADRNDPFPILNPAGYQTSNPALKIISPQDGAVLDFGDTVFTWGAVAGATGYAVDVFDLDGSDPNHAIQVANIPAGTQTFTLGKDRITAGHHYKVEVSYYLPPDSDAGYGGRGSMPPINVRIGKSTGFLPLVITSPAVNAELSFASPIPLSWQVPFDADGLDAVALIQGSSYNDFPVENGQDISQKLYVGNNHITVSLKSGDKVVYQGSLDIRMLPSSPASSCPDILSPANGSTVDPNQPLTLTWKPVGGATNYIINLYQGNGGNKLGTYYAGTLTRFQINPLSNGTYDIYITAEVDNGYRAGQHITVNAPKADPNAVPEPPLNTLPLKIISPGNNLTFTGNEPIIVKWEVPKYAGYAKCSVTKSSSASPSSVYSWSTEDINGKNINQEHQKGYKDLKPGFNRITITLREPDSITQYQGFVDLYYVP